MTVLDVGTDAGGAALDGRPGALAFLNVGGILNLPLHLFGDLVRIGRVGFVVCLVSHEHSQVFCPVLYDGNCIGDDVQALGAPFDVERAVSDGLAIDDKRRVVASVDDDSVRNGLVDASDQVGLQGVHGAAVEGGILRIIPRLKIAVANVPFEVVRKLCIGGGYTVLQVYMIASFDGEHIESHAGRKCEVQLHAGAGAFTVGIGLPRQRQRLVFKCRCQGVNVGHRRHDLDDDGLALVILGIEVAGNLEHQELLVVHARQGTIDTVVGHQTAFVADEDTNLPVAFIGSCTVGH